MIPPRSPVTRADLPETFTPETLRSVPMSVVRWLTRPGNGVLDPDEQREFDTAVRELMRQTRAQVSTQLDQSDWARIVQDLKSARGGPGGRPIGRQDRNLERLTNQIGRQIETVEQLSPDVDWSFARPPQSDRDAETPPALPAADDDRTVGEVTDALTDNVELVAVISEIADVSKRTYALEQQRELQNTRSVFFGFVVSVAVLVAGWAPIVTASWPQRWWTLGLTLLTCLIAGVVYALVRRRQRTEPRSGP